MMPAQRKAILVTPILGGKSDILGGAHDGKPVIILQFQAVDGKRYKPIMVSIEDAERLHECLTDAILAHRRERVANAL